MRTLLKRASTELYFQGPDQWTADPSKGRDFRTIDRAMQFVQTWKLKDVELAFAFGDSATGVPIENIGLGYER